MYGRFWKNRFSQKNWKNSSAKKGPFFPVIFTEKTLFPVIFAT
jgi:hypothetical protein